MSWQLISRVVRERTSLGNDGVNVLLLRQNSCQNLLLKVKLKIHITQVWSPNRPIYLLTFAAAAASVLLE